jgi:UDP-GlcNAc:undecaprenyl-phosphate GlcNAc-1-phosphate transferase
MESYLIFLSALAAGLLGTGLAKRVATRLEIGTYPNQRNIHSGFKPLLGGIGIFAGTVAGILIAIFWKEYYWQMFNIKYAAILFSAFLMMLTGMYDDVRGLHAGQKFLLQFIAATIVIFSGCRIETVLNPFGDPLQLHWASIPLTYLWLIGVTNAVNLLDGLDGLAGGVSFIALGSFAILAFVQQDWMTFAVSLAMMGGILGFLRYNYHPATIFMGDTGSLFLGFILAALALKGLQRSEGNIALLIPITILGVPIGDTALAFFRRLNRGEHPFKADKDHLHHRLLFLGLSHRQSVHTIYIISVLFGLAALLMAGESGFYGVVLLLLLIGVIVFILRRLGYLEAARSKSYLGDEEVIRVLRQTAPLSMRRFWHKFFLLLTDIITINLALMASYWLRFYSGMFETSYSFAPDYFLTPALLVVVTLFFLGLFSLNGLYGMRWDLSRFDQAMRVSRVIVFAILLVFLITLDPEHLFASSRLNLLFFASLLLIFVNLGRLVLIQVEKKFSVLEYAMHNTLMIGSGEKARKTLKDIRKNPHLLYSVVGYVDKSASAVLGGDVKCLGTYEDIPQLIRDHGVEEVIIAISERSRDQILNIVAYGENLRVNFKIIPQMYDVISGHKTEEVIGHGLMRLFPDHMLPWQWLLKRGLDVLVAFTAMVVLAPLFVIIVLTQLLRGIRPLFVMPESIGKNGKIYGQVRFNTGSKDSGWDRFLRRSYVDRLPALINVVLGFQSLVGPRPETPETVDELRRKIKFYNRRFMIRPGLTGLAQLRFRYSDSLKDKREQFKQDLFYLENMSIRFDLRILLRSLFILFFRRLG